MTAREIAAETASCLSVALLAEAVVVLFMLIAAVVLAGLKVGAI